MKMRKVYTSIYMIMHNGVHGEVGRILFFSVDFADSDDGMAFKQHIVYKMK